MKSLLISAMLFLIFDALYLSIISSLFSKMILNIQSSPISLNYIATFLVYLFLIFINYYFIIKNKKSPFEAFILGTSIYFIYDLTNKATIKNWKWNLTIIDGIWGGILFYLVTYYTYILHS